MIVALIDNGSLEPAAQRNLRAIAAALSKCVGVAIEPVSWKHSDRIPATALDGRPAWTLAPFVRAQLARGEREFIFAPFFISAQGAIGSALRTDLENLRRDAGDFSFTFTDGLAARGSLPCIVADRVREMLIAKKLFRPHAIVVDHGGPSSVSAALRDSIAAEVRALLTDEIGPLAAASMEGTHGPLLSEQLAAPGFDHGEVVVAPLFLSPGRHARPDGDVSKICGAAPARCHLTGLVGDHPSVVEVLTAALGDALAARRHAAIPVEAGGYVS